MTDPAIAILPYGSTPSAALSAKPLSDLTWPLGIPRRLAGKAVGDLARTDHLIVYPNTGLHFRLRRGTRARISMMMGEPSDIHARHIRLLRWSWRRFFRVMSFNETLVRSLPNGVFLPFGSTWVPDWRGLDLTKTGMVSLIASEKRDTEGHRLRHAIVDWARGTDRQVDIMGRGYRPFDRKSDGLAPYRYSVIIENGREENYFSEKLVDCLLCGTVPIYWGCPNIDRFFDTSGFVICHDAEELKAAIASVSVEDYTARAPRILAQREQAAEYGAWERRAAEALRAEIEGGGPAPRTPRSLSAR
jgi:hypothetical protein